MIQETPRKALFHANTRTCEPIPAVPGFMMMVAHESHPYISRSRLAELSAVWERRSYGEIVSLGHHCWAITRRVRLKVMSALRKSHG